MVWSPPRPTGIREWGPEALATSYYLRPEALAFYELALRRAPQDAEAQRGAALALLFLNRPEEALQQVEGSLRSRPTPGGRLLRERILKRLSGSEEPAGEEGSRAQ